MKLFCKIENQILPIKKFYNEDFEKVLVLFLSQNVFRKLYSSSKGTWNINVLDNY